MFVVKTDRDEGCRITLPDGRIMVIVNIGRDGRKNRFGIQAPQDIKVSFDRRAAESATEVER